MPDRDAEDGLVAGGNGSRPAPEAAVAHASERPGLGLPAKLLLLTGLFVMLAEVLIFVPSVANFRNNWLSDRLIAARLASLAVEAVPGGGVPDSLRMELLNAARVRAVAIKRDDQRRVVLPADGQITIDESYDMRAMGNSAHGAASLARLASIVDALAAFVSRPGRTIRVIGEPMLAGGGGRGEFVEIVLPEAPLKAAMLDFALNILGLSLIISGISAALVYFALNRLLVQPMMRISRNMLRFSQNPEDLSRIIVPSSRSDEIGTAERELAHMQQELSQMLHQKSRLAQLGLAVSKINHDLRNMLANAQLISDRLGTLPDPSVQRFAPKLIATLDRAINFCNDTLRFGKAEEAAPRRELLPLRELVVEVGDGLMLPRKRLALEISIDPELRIDADRDHLYRVLNNLVRNAMQAIEGAPATAPGQITVEARRAGASVIVEVRDTGPGVPEKVRARLFRAFQGNARKGGSGLGLVIAAELVAAHGGTLQLMETTTGAGFRLEIPDQEAKGA